MPTKRRRTDNRVNPLVRYGVTGIISIILMAILIVLLSPMISDINITMSMAIVLSVLLSIAIMLGAIIEEIIDGILPKWGVIGETIIILVLAMVVIGPLAESVLLALPTTVKLFLMLLAVINTLLMKAIVKMLT